MTTYTEDQLQHLVGKTLTIMKGGRGFVDDDLHKSVKVVGTGNYFGEVGLKVQPVVGCEYATLGGFGLRDVVGCESFNIVPTIVEDKNTDTLASNEIKHSVKTVRIKEGVEDCWYTPGQEYDIHHYIESEDAFFTQEDFDQAILYRHQLDTTFILAKHCTPLAYKEVSVDEYVESKTEETKTTNSALDKQVSGSHYKGCAIQPVEYIDANGLDYLQGNVVKYVTRHKLKNGRGDVEKAIHYLELILELQYDK